MLKKLAFIFIVLSMASCTSQEPLPYKTKIDHISNTLNCDSLDKTLKHDILRIKQLQSEVEENFFRNSGVGLTSFFIFAPAVLAVEGNTNEENELKSLQKRVNKVAEINDQKNCLAVNERLKRFQTYLAKI